ncbi:MAG: acyl carrier protein [Betaproteobacteria bacterium]|nr:acyl carrier protein [Betaproteobacteria bacterium]
MTATVATIKDIIGKLRGTPDLSAQLPDTADILQDVGLDSLELLQFMLELEERLAIRIDFEQLEYSALNSISALALFLDTMPPSYPPASPA